MSDVRNVVVIGSGPSGLTASLYLSRANLEPLCIAGTLPGGQLMLTTEVDNFPGFPEGIMGPELMSNMRKQSERFGTTFVDKNATKVDFSTRPYKVYMGEEMIEAHSVVIATGSDTRWLGLESEQKLIGKGVSSCATCDGFFFKEKTIAVVGGGDSAMEEATFLTRFASKVYVIHRRDKLRASKVMQDRAFDNEKIEFIWNSQVTEVLGDDKVTGIKLKNTDGEESELALDGLFVAIGHIPNTKIFDEIVTTDDHGYITKSGRSTATNIDGVFVAGDVYDTVYKQAITAAGMGCQAALDCERWLEAQGE